MDEGEIQAAAGTGAEVVVEHVTKTYDDRVHALVDVSLHLRPGELVVLTGPSGCGKSTLLNMIGALDRPDSGSIVVGGQSVMDLKRPERYRRDTIGFVFQLHHLLGVLSAKANVELPLVPTSMSASARGERALELLREVGLDHRSEHLPGKLSGGERQRVAIARALMNRPRLLLADEPTGALDSVAGDRVLALLCSLRDRLGMTVLLVSHDTSVGRLADRMLHMADGRLVDDGAPPEAGSD